MRRERAIDRGRSGDRSMQRDARARRRGPRTEALHIRSYDHQWSYDLDVEIVTPDGETVFRERYYLPPGHTESEASIVPRGEYEIRRALDTRYEGRLECQIDPTSEHTAVIEVGNGSLALTEGLQG